MTRRSSAKNGVLNSLICVHLAAPRNVLPSPKNEARTSPTRGNTLASLQTPWTLPNSANPRLRTEVGWPLMTMPSSLCAACSETKHSSCTWCSSSLPRFASPMASVRGTYAAQGSSTRDSSRPVAEQPDTARGSFLCRGAISPLGSACTQLGGVDDPPWKIMDFHDFLRCLGTSGCRSHPPPQVVCRPTLEGPRALACLAHEDLDHEAVDHVLDRAAHELQGPHHLPLRTLDDPHTQHLRQDSC